MKKVTVTKKQEAAIDYAVEFFTNTMFGLPKHDMIHKQVKPYREQLMALKKKLKSVESASGQTAA